MDHISAWYVSFWDGALAVYKLLLCAVRLYLIRRVPTGPGDKDMDKEWGYYRSTGLFLLASDVPLAVIAMEIVLHGQSCHYSGTLIYVVALYVFYSLGVSISNAIKFTEPGGSVTLRQTSMAEGIEVSVSDTGCGMTQETINHIMAESKFVKANEKIAARAPLLQTFHCPGQWWTRFCSLSYRQSRRLVHLRRSSSPASPVPPPPVGRRFLAEKEMSHLPGS